MMLLTFLDVTGRTLFGRALTGTVESVTLLMGVLVFSGLAYTEMSNKHVVVDVLQALFSRPIKRLSHVINLAIGVFITGIMTWRLGLSAISIFEEAETTMIWGLPYWPVAIVMVIGLTLFLVVLILKLAQSIQALAARE
jgi:TRAP-type C4-dicarboxylate transport system permease small subunit